VLLAAVHESAFGTSRHIALPHNLGRFWSEGDHPINALATIGHKGAPDWLAVRSKLLSVMSAHLTGPGLSAALFHCLRLSPMTFIAVIDAWLRLA